MPDGVSGRAGYFEKYIMNLFLCETGGGAIRKYLWERVF